VSHARALAWDTARMTDRLLAFAGVCVLLTFVPGVDTAMVTRAVGVSQAGR
jgi:threonine/homoserine/homoserine lactone efflux protein